MADQLHKLGKLAYRDTGAVPDSADYTTVVIIHGYGWASGVFERVVPFAATNNARLVLVNRRDFPGSEPYSDAERAQLVVAQAAEGGAEALRTFMADRARELYAFLESFIAQEDIPPRNGARGGLILVSWSFGAMFLSAFLATARTFRTNDVEVYAYMRRAILYDPPYHALGYADPAEVYHPLYDAAIPLADRPLAFSRWVSGYYTHGESADALERRTPADTPVPTILAMSPEDVAAHFVPGPAGENGSDSLLLSGGIGRGVNGAMWKDALYLAEAGKDDEDEGESDDWANVEVRWLWCDRSVWEMPWGTWAVRKEVEEANAKGLRMRPVTIARLRGANHFTHWDEPERLLRALLAEETEGL